MQICLCPNIEQGQNMKAISTLWTGHIVQPGSASRDYCMQCDRPSHLLRVTQDRGCCSAVAQSHMARSTYRPFFSCSHDAQCLIVSEIEFSCKQVEKGETLTRFRQEPGCHWKAHFCETRWPQKPLRKRIQTEKYLWSRAAATSWANLWETEGGGKPGEVANWTSSNLLWFCRAAVARTHAQTDRHRHGYALSLDSRCPTVAAMPTKPTSGVGLRKSDGMIFYFKTFSWGSDSLWALAGWGPKTTSISQKSTMLKK